MFEVEAGRKNVGASPEQDELRKAMEEGFAMAFWKQERQAVW